MMYITGKNEAFSEALIKTYMSEVGGSFKVSAIFETQNAIHNSLDDFDKTGELNSINKYSENSGIWVLSAEK